MSEENKEEEKIEEFKKQANVELSQDLLDKILQGGELEFEHEGIKYRVRKPSFADKQKVYKEKVRKFTELLKDKSLMMEEDLKTQYKERGIDIDEYQNKINNLEIEKKSIQLKVGEILTGSGVESDAETYAKRIQEIINHQVELSRKKSSLMEYCLEQQLLVYLYAYLTVLVAEKQVGEKWNKVWSSYEEFENCPDESLVNRIAFNAGILMREEINL